MIRLIEYLITRRRLTQAHRTSPTVNPKRNLTNRVSRLGKMPWVGMESNHEQ